MLELLQSWGGSTIAYRKRMIDSPSYTLNHEEIEKALEEGIRFAEGLTPVRVEVDRFGHASALVVRAGGESGRGEHSLPARSILVAAGTQPNTVLAREDADALRPRRALLPRGRRRGQPRHARTLRRSPPRPTCCSRATARTAT